MATSSQEHECSIPLLFKAALCATRRIGPHFFTQIRQCVHRFLLKHPRLRRDPSIRHGDEPHFHIHAIGEMSNLRVQEQPRSEFSVAARVDVVKLFDNTVDHFGCTSSGGQRTSLLKITQ